MSTGSENDRELVRNGRPTDSKVPPSPPHQLRTKTSGGPWHMALGLRG
jgi:hypothetical protein